MVATKAEQIELIAPLRPLDIAQAEKRARGERQAWGKRGTGALLKLLGFIFFFLFTEVERQGLG